MAQKKLKHVWMVQDASVEPGKPPRTYWTKIGVAFEGEDGALTLELAAIPTSGKMVIKDAAPLPFDVTKVRGAA